MVNRVFPPSAWEYVNPFALRSTLGPIFGGLLATFCRTLIRLFRYTPATASTTRTAAAANNLLSNLGLRGICSILAGRDAQKGLAALPHQRTGNDVVEPLFTLGK